MSVLGTVIKDPSHFLFKGSRNQLNHPKTDGYSRFRLVLAITALPRLIRLNKATTLLNLSRSVRILACVSACTSMVQEYKPASLSTYSVKIGLRIDLPPADDALLGNPCPFGGGDSHPSLLLLPPGYSILIRSTGPHGPASAQSGRPPTRLQQ